MSLIETKKYSLLEDFFVDVEVEYEEFETFSLCFWVYLFNSTTFPSTIIRQVHSDMSVSAPFLVLDENKNMMLLPLSLLHKDAPDPIDTASWMEVPNASTKTEFPLEKWVLCCFLGPFSYHTLFFFQDDRIAYFQVSRRYMRLHIDGEILGEQYLTPLLTNDTSLESPRKISLFSVVGDGYSVKGFIQSAEVLPAGVPVKYHHVKDPPLQLSVNKPSTSDIEIDDDGVWNLVGGKASCHRIFSLDVVLSNALGHPVHKDLEVVASLLYADSGTPVEKTSEGEAPLLASYDGIEYSADDRPSKLLNGCVHLKLKISQLSSKSDNRLFCIKFEIPKIKGYPFLEAVSKPIRCISRSRNCKPVSASPKRLNHAEHPPDGVLALASSNGFSDLQYDASSVKRVKLREERMSEVEQPHQEQNFQAQLSRQFENGNGMSMEWRPQNHEEETSSTDSENPKGRDPVFGRYTISDSTIFRYCLGSMAERSLLLKEIANNTSDEEIEKFAEQVSVYSGCSHHSYQIKIARKLIAEGTNAWILISQNNQHVHWDSAVFEIEEYFMRIAQCSSRSLIQQDFELLRKISGCYDYITQENFEKMWCWLFPVTLTISRSWVNGMWSSVSPKWIEGFITKEDSENSLQGQEPGTFILRFPTSRSWPHPDAGSLVVTYVGHDFAFHHRLLTIDHICSESNMDAKLLQKMLLADPELSRLGRAIRSH